MSLPKAGRQARAAATEVKELDSGYELSRPILDLRDCGGPILQEPSLDAEVYRKYSVVYTLTHVLGD